MRTFSCFTSVRERSVADLTFIVTSSFERAQELARRELLRDGGISVEICEGGTFLCTIFADEARAASTLAA
jgi:hypothetical protein